VPTICGSQVWLGHENVETTARIYLHGDLAIKERAHERTRPLHVKPGRSGRLTLCSPFSLASDVELCGPQWANLGPPPRVGHHPAHNPPLHIGSKRTTAEGARCRTALAYAGPMSMDTASRDAASGSSSKNACSVSVSCRACPGLAPHDGAGVVVRHQRQILVVFTPGDLVHPDVDQPV
jgi:hypothetical protein